MVFLNPAPHLHFTKEQVCAAFEQIPLWDENNEQTRNFAFCFMPASAGPKSVPNPKSDFHINSIQKFLGLEESATFEKPAFASLPVWFHDPNDERLPSSLTCSNYGTISEVLKMMVTPQAAVPDRRVEPSSRNLRVAALFMNKKALRRPKVRQEQLLLVGAGTGSLTQLPIRGRTLRFMLGAAYRLLSSVFDEYPSKATLETLYDKVRMCIVSFLDAVEAFDATEKWTVVTFNGNALDDTTHTWMARQFRRGQEKHGSDFKVSIYKKTLISFSISLTENFVPTGTRKENRPQP